MSTAVSSANRAALLVPDRPSFVAKSFHCTAAAVVVDPGVNKLVVFFSFISIPFIVFALSVSLYLLFATQIRGHIAGSSAPLPSTVRALHFYREKISALSSLADSRRIVLTHARRS